MAYTKLDIILLGNCGYIRHRLLLWLEVSVNLLFLLDVVRLTWLTTFNQTI